MSWAGRLSHLPRPLIALLVGGGGVAGEMRPVVAHALARQVARMAAAAGGSVLATTSRRTGQEATDVLASGLAASMHVLYRWGEPGENPYAGMIALADITIVTGDSPAMISEACGGDAPVMIASMGDKPSHRRLHDLLYQAGQARPLGALASRYGHARRWMRRGGWRPKSGPGCRWGPKPSTDTAFD